MPNLFRHPTCKVCTCKACGMQFANFAFLTVTPTLYFKEAHIIFDDELRKQTLPFDLAFQDKTNFP